MSEDQTSKHVRVLGVWRLAALTMAAVIGIRNLPQMAQYGWGSLFFYALATVLFFIPAALVSAELATGWPRRGGVKLKHASTRRSSPSNATWPKKTT